MPQDWITAPEHEWRKFMADHMETMATNQSELSSKFSDFLAGCGERHLKIEHRLTSVEHKSNWITIGILAVSSLVANLKAWWS